MRTASIALAVIMVLACVPAGAMERNTVKSWAELVDQLKNDQAASATRDELVKLARSYVELGIVKRVYRFEDVGKYRSGLDGRAIPLEPEIKETFALAMSDSNACAVMTSELPTLAAAYRLTGDAAFRDRIVAQLEEMTTWSPLQRPGWTLYAPGRRLPPDGKDGNWLGTGWGIRAIADTLEILPEGAISTSLRRRLDKRLANEIDSIVDDWNVKRPWFVRGNNAITNQWALPTEGLVRACLVLGKDKHKDAYELGVRNLRASLGSHGAAGEFEEGIAYAAVTVTSLLSAGRAMAMAGDRSAIDHPFLKSFPLWAVHHLQPGNTVINCFDCTLGKAVSGFLRPLLSTSFLCTGSSTACWGIDRVGPSSCTLPVALAAAARKGVKTNEPLLYASYERATMVNWRDSWSRDASGIWIRGGHSLDQHDHQDRGHISYVHKGRPILIEDGTPVYSEPDIKRVQSCRGHSVLQIGDNDARKAVAPISVSRLDANGGDVTVDATACYEEAKKWTRRVIWSADALEVRDEVAFPEGIPNTPTFRWHLASGEKAAIEGEGASWRVAWPDGVMKIDGSAPIEVSQQAEPQYTLPYQGDSKYVPGDNHTCIVVRTQATANAVQLTTSVTPR